VSVSTTAVVVSGRFLSPALCRRIVEEVEREAWWQWGEVNHGGGSHVDLEMRSVQVSPVIRGCEAVVGGQLGRVARGLARSFGRIESIEGPNLLRYRPGDFVGPHPDENPRTRFRPRKVTVVAFLNDGGFEGGVLSLRRPQGGRTLHVPPVAGRFVAFPSDTIHAVSATTGGNRYALVAWLH
jgi:predicted 2-oxoglutarate/Fe(II)-dependent dioxygenase YbiX